MIEDIKKIIENNLPEQVGNVLRKRLTKAEEDEIKVNIQREELVNKDKTIQDLQEKISNYKILDERNKKLEEREMVVKEKERNLEIGKLKYELDSEKEKTMFSKEVALGLVRNIEYRKSIFDNENQSGYYDSNGRWIQPGNIAKSIDETNKAQ